MKNTHTISQRAQLIEPFHVMHILAQARQLEADGHDVIHLEVGEPDFATPDAVNQAARRAIDQGKTRYTPAMGIAELRQAIADYYQSELGAQVSASNIVITPGASGALQLALAALIDPGRKIMLADPGYPCNRHFIRLLEGCANTINVDETTRFQLTSTLIERFWDEQTVAAMIATPSNPTGTLVMRDEMQQIINVIEQKSAWLLVDEIYQGLVYDQPDYTAASMSDSVIVINSFSKFFSMTGWRLGWMVVPDVLLQSVDRLAQNLFLAPPTISQYAALECFSATNLSVLRQQRDELKLRRDYLVNALSQLGFSIEVIPGGAFYIYANISGFSDDSYSFCERLLKEAHVAITPGIDFGSHRAKQYVRFAYTQPVERLQIAIDRLNDFITSC